MYGPPLPTHYPATSQMYPPAAVPEGTVLEAGGSSGGGGGMGGEHMASFQPAYEIPALRDWHLT